MIIGPSPKVPDNLSVATKRSKLPSCGSSEIGKNRKEESSIIFQNFSSTTSAQHGQGRDLRKPANLAKTGLGLGFRLSSEVELNDGMIDKEAHR